MSNATRDQAKLTQTLSMTAHVGSNHDQMVTLVGTYSHASISPFPGTNDLLSLLCDYLLIHSGHLLTLEIISSGTVFKA